MINNFLSAFGTTTGILIGILVVIIPYLAVSALLKWAWFQYDKWLVKKHEEKILKENLEGEQDESPFTAAGVQYE